MDYKKKGLPNVYCNLKIIFVIGVTPAGLYALNKEFGKLGIFYISCFIFNDKLHIHDIGRIGIPRQNTQDARFTNMGQSVNKAIYFVHICVFYIETATRYTFNSYKICLPNLETNLKYIHLHMYVCS